MPRPFYVFIKQYQWAHLVLGIAGNISFVVGSIFYLHESLKTPAPGVHRWQHRHAGRLARQRGR